MSKKPRKILAYSQEQIQDALEDIGRGSSVVSAARRHGVPRITLLYKVNGKIKKNRMGPNPILSQEEENILVNWIGTLAKAGFPGEIK
uniref:HTH psq-type domain-containing protein n=1 Tax=Rhodnius prolixus TaxID=13249 RepID=T1HGR0_RHOPR